MQSLPSSLTVTTIIPTKGRGTTILPCIASVAAQTRQPLELIIVDQNEDDQIGAQLHELIDGTSIQLAHLWRPDIRGLAEARNVGFAHSHGEIILFLDDDVILGPSYIEGILSIYAADPAERVGGVGGCIVNEIAPREWLDRFWHGPFYDGRPKFQARPAPYFRTNALSGSNMSYRRSVFAAFRVDESLTGYSFGEDWELGVRISQHHELILTNKARLEHRHSPLHRLPEPELLTMIMRNRHAFFLKHRSPAERRQLRVRAALAWYRAGMVLFATGAARAGKMHCAQTVLRELWRQCWQRTTSAPPAKDGASC